MRLKTQDICTTLLKSLTYNDIMRYSSIFSMHGKKGMQQHVAEFKQACLHSTGDKTQRMTECQLCFQTKYAVD